MKTIYAVSSGEYSDYSVDRLFESKDDAEAYAARLNAADTWHSAFVEEFEYHEAGEALQMWTRHTVYLTLENSGLRMPGDMWDFSSVVVGQEPEFVAATPYGNGSLLHASGPDLERCRKSVRDRWAHIRAEREGVA